jgi:hypothetical protein
MFIAIVPVVVMVLGLLLWTLGSGKAQPIGEKMFTCGLLVTLFVFARVTVRIGAG